MDAAEITTLRALARWRQAGLPCAVATVVATWRSAPRPVGALMAVSADGQVVGSVSGGCVEGAVHDLATTVLHDQTPVLDSYGVADTDAFALGLTCGGTIDVLVTPVTTHDTWVDELLAAIDRRVAVVLSTTVSGDGLGRRLVDASGGSPDAPGRTRQPDASTLVQTFAPVAELLVYGANDFAVAIAAVAAHLDVRVTVCDARAVFATVARFPSADEVVVDWPHRHFARLLAEGRIDGQTALCVLSHDEKFDIPLLLLALRSRAGYVGAIGSRRTGAHRLATLREQGMSESECLRLRSPIGLDIGARTPHEVAVAVAAEIIATRRGGAGSPLFEGSGPIHR